jgi:hypothetical protein
MAPNLDSLYGTGQWIWGPEEAAQAEGLKQAAKIQACPDIQFSKYPNMGWCPSTNMAIVTDGAGNPLYPGAAGGDCPGGGIVMMAANCPPPPGSGGGSGSGSGGGPAVPNSVSALCATNPLTPQCMAALLPYSGCSTNGALGLALSSGYPGQFQPFNDANADLVRRGFTLNTSLISDGALAFGDAFNSMVGLQRQASAGIKSAQNICLDGTIDYCPGPTDTGPFTMGCIIKAAMAMGYPATSPLLAYPPYFDQFDSTKTWQNVLDALSYWIADAKRAGVNGLYDVYGIKVAVPPLPYLAVGTQFSLRPVAYPGNHVMFPANQGQPWPVATDTPDNTASAIAAASSGNMASSVRSLYTQNMKNISTFVITAGNNQVQNYVSIQSVQYPGYFIRHSNFSIWLMPNPGGDDQFNSDSSFQIMPQGNGQLMFQSYNYPTQTIVHGVAGQQMVLRQTVVGGNNIFYAIAPLQ